MRHGAVDQILTRIGVVRCEQGGRDGATEKGNGRDANEPEFTATSTLATVVGWAGTKNNAWLSVDVTTFARIPPISAVNCEYLQNPIAWLPLRCALPKIRIDEIVLLQGNLWESILGCPLVAPEELSNVIHRQRISKSLRNFIELNVLSPVFLCVAQQRENLFHWNYLSVNRGTEVMLNQFGLGLGRNTNVLVLATLSVAEEHFNLLGGAEMLNKLVEIVVGCHWWSRLSRVDYFEN